MINSNLIYSWKKFQRWLVVARPFLLLLAAFVIMRLLAILLLRPGGFIVNQGPDMRYYFEVARLTGSGERPFFEFWMEYPPLMPWLLTWAYRLSLHFPVWETPIFWFNTIFRLLLLPFDAACLILVYANLRILADREHALLGAALWALLFTPLFTLLSWFDPLTLSFLLLGLYGFLRQWPIVAGLAMGFGFMAKVLPVAIAPVGLFVFRKLRSNVIYISSAIGAVLLIMLLPLIQAPQYVIAWVRALLNVSAWETVWALLEGYNGYGLVAPLSSRFDPAAASFTVSEPSLPWLPITLVFAGLYLLLITRRIEWDNKQRVAQFSLFSLVWFVLYSKGYSPQWATYLSALALIALPLGRGLGYSLILSLLLAAEWPVAFIVLPEVSWFLAVIVIWRTAVTLLIGLDTLARALPAHKIWLTIQRWAFPLTLTLSVILTLALIRPTYRAYAAIRLEKDPLAPFITTLKQTEPESTLITLTQPALLERLHPYLSEQTIALMPQARPDTNVADWLTTQVKEHDNVWLLFDNKEESGRILADNGRSWLQTHACPALETWYDDVWVGNYVTAPVGDWQSAVYQFSEPISLLSYTTPPVAIYPGNAFCLQLRWTVQEQLENNYAIFVHVLDENGQLAAQTDLMPIPSMTDWTPREEVTTRHGLILPSTLTYGKYEINVGLYNPATGLRLPLQNGDDKILLGNMVLSRMD
jgi:hypothetical protein